MGIVQLLDQKRCDDIDQSTTGRGRKPMLGSMKPRSDGYCLDGTPKADDDSRTSRQHESDLVTSTGTLSRLRKQEKYRMPGGFVPDAKTAERMCTERLCDSNMFDVRVECALDDDDVQASTMRDAMKWR